MPIQKTTKNGKRKTDRLTPTEAAPDEQQASESGEPEFFEQIQKFTADEWQSGLKVYVYRTWPVIDRRDDSHFLAKIREPFDEDYLLRNFGSGKYYLRLNNGSGETVNSKTVSIHNPSYPPKVSPDEVVQADPRNETYFKVWPLAPAVETAAAADTAALHELSKLATKALEQRESTAVSNGEQAALNSVLVKWALEQITKERDSNDPSRVAGLVKELKSLFPQQQPVDGLAMVDRVLTIVQKLNPTPTTPEPPDPIDYVEKVLTVADRLRPLQSGPSMSEGDGGNLASIAAIVHEAADLLKNPLTIAAQVWAASRNQNSAPSASTVPQAQPSPAQPTGAPPPPAEPSTTPPPGAPPQSLMILANAITPVMLKWIHEDAPGAELGSSFAGWLADGWGIQELQSLQAVGSQGIIDLYRRSPVWAVLAPMEEKFRQFVKAFVAWQPSADDDGQESADTGEPEDA